MTRRILIKGAAFENKGAEAMIRCVQRGIISALSDSVGLLDLMPGETWSAEELRGLVPRTGLNHNTRWRLGATAIQTLFGGVAPETRSRWIEAMTGADLKIDAVLDISGYGMGDPVLGPEPVRWRARTLTRAREMILRDTELLEELRVPAVYLPQCWGPFTKRRARELADRRLQFATRIYARDRQTLEWLADLASFSSEKVSLASDIAFTFKGASRETGRELLQAIGIRIDDAPIIAIVPNMRVYERVEGEGPNNLYVQRLTAVARRFMDEFGCQVVVMPHEIKMRPHPVPDDRFLCELIGEGASAGGEVKAATGDYSAEELKSMIGEAELLIGSRYHSIVAALSQRVPVVSIAWAHKYRELLGDVGLGEYIVEHQQLGQQSLLDLCEQAWHDRGLMVASLEEAVPRQEASARAVLEQTIGLVQNGER